MAFRRLRRDWRELAAAFPSHRGLDFWLWANRYGAFVRPELCSVLAPFPPANYLVAGSSDMSERQFANSGCDYYEQMERALNEIGRSWWDMHSVLDFGCGAGRVLRLFTCHRNHMRIHGADVNTPVVDWLGANLDFGKFHVGFSKPPTPFHEATFDAIFSISVFTHLTAVSQGSWLREFHRLLKPNGILFQTVHGQHAMTLCERHESWRNAINVAPETFAALQKGLREDGFAWGPTKWATNAGEDYGISFQNEPYIRATWRLGYDLVGVWPGRIDDWQDLVALRRRPGAALAQGPQSGPDKVELVQLAGQGIVGQPLRFRAVATGGEDLHFRFVINDSGSYFRQLCDWAPCAEIAYTPWEPGTYDIIVHADSGPGPHAVPAAGHGIKVTIK